jgi:photosystem II stability/assembly factor-like uncharacterized protein
MKAFVFTKRTFFLLTILAFLAAGIFAVIRNPQAIGLYRCGDALLTKAQVAEARGISTDMIDQLGEDGRLSVSGVCDIPQDKLEQAIFFANNPKPDHPGEAIEFRNLQLQDENGYIPPDGLLKAAEHIKAMRKYSSLNDNNDAAQISRDSWQWLGPGNIGGRVRAIVVHPTDPNILWVGSVSGGIWKTTDGGASWVTLDDFMANMAVSNMIIDPGDPDVLYAGTGEGFAGDGIRGAGIFKTTDGGTTWNQLASTANSDFYYVNRLSLSPDRKTILAATRTGIWRSTDGGANWTHSLIDSEVLDIDFNPTDGTKAIASGVQMEASKSPIDGGGGGGGSTINRVWYSTNGGVNWKLATHNFTNTNWEGFGRVELAYAPSNPKIVYASADKNSGELWKSTDGGQRYLRVSTGYQYLGNQGWYDNIVWVHPTNPNFIVVGGIDNWRSTDGGRTFTQVSVWWQAPYFTHADNHIILAAQNFGTTRSVYFGNDGGVYRVTNIETVTPTSGWTELNNGLGITQFYGAAGNPTTGEIVGGTQDNGTLFYTPANGAEGWNLESGGDGGFSAADPTDPNYFYGEYIWLMIHRSNNRGQSGEYIYNGIADAGGCANFIAPFILDPNNSNTMLAGGCSLWRSTDVKAPEPVWSNIKPEGGPISAIAVAPGNSDAIWVGDNDGSLYKTSNGTSDSPAWSQVLGLPSRYVTRITIDKNDNQIVYVTFGGFSPDNVWRTTDGGATWSDITGSGLTGLPDLPVRSLVINPNNSDWIYIGTELGIFASEDSGATWRVPHDGPTNTSVDELFWMGDSLIAATHGRGLFKTRGNPPPVAPSNFHLTSVTANSDSMAWDDSANEMGYKIYKWNGFDAFEYFALVDTNVTTFTDTTVTCGTSDWYELSVYNIDGESGHTGSIQADLPACPPVSNDDFDNASLISEFPYTVTQDTYGATAAVDDPPLTSCNRKAGLASVWYVYTPATSHSLLLDTFGSNFDTMIGVWTGRRGNLTEVACNDNASASSQSFVYLPVTAGATYFIEISGANGPIQEPQFETPVEISPDGVQQNRTGSGTLVLNASASPVESMTFLSNGPYDGWTLETFENSETGGSINNSSPTFYVGDDGQNRQYRGILSFDTSSLPKSATIASVTLKVKRSGFLGTNPFTTHGSLLVDIPDFTGFFGTKVNLELLDFEAQAILGIGAFGSTPNTDGWYTFNMDPHAFTFINSWGSTQFRLRFSLDDNNDRDMDVVMFFSGNATSANKPVLEVLFYP